MAEKFVPCPDCVRGTQKVDCPICFGNGREICPRCHGDRVIYDSSGYNERTCPICHGHGDLHCTTCMGPGYWERTCPTCLGVGQLEESVVSGLVKQRLEAARKAEKERVAKERKAEEDRLAAQVRAAEAQRLAALAQAEQERIRKAEEAARPAAEERLRQEEIRRQSEEKEREQERRAKLIGCSVCLLAVCCFGTFIVIQDVGKRLQSFQAAPVQNSQAAPVAAAERALTEADLSGKSKWKLTVMRNEPYARHGYRFGKGKESAPLAAYFSQQPWYHPSTESSDSAYAQMSPAEQDNVKLILHYQNAHGLR